MTANPVFRKLREVGDPAASPSHPTTPAEFPRMKHALPLLLLLLLPFAPATANNIRLRAVTMTAFDPVDGFLEQYGLDVLRD